MVNLIITHVEAVTGGRVFTGVCLSVFLRDISKINKARITKHDIEMFHHEFCKPIYFEVKRSTVKVTRYKSVSVCFGHLPVIYTPFCQPLVKVDLQPCSHFC